MQSAARSYFTTQVTTTTQGDLLIMLFDAALKFLSQARDRMLARDFAQKGILISKALDILAELQATLNPGKGGKLADRLKQLYMYCSSRLLRANRTMDPLPLDETVRILTGLRDAFAEANSRVESKPVAATSTQASGRFIPNGGVADRQTVSISSGAAEYAMVGGVSGGPAVKPLTAVAAEVVPPALDGDASAVEDAAALEREDSISTQSVLLEAASQMRVHAVEDTPRPMTPVRRAMAAYSTRSMVG